MSTLALGAYRRWIAVIGGVYEDWRRSRRGCHLSWLQTISRSSSSLPRRRPRMVAPGGAPNTERPWQAPSVDEGYAQ
jgi:hypothetical protein